MDEQAVNQSNLNCREADGSWPRPGNEVVDEITETECENLKANTGLDGTKKNNSDDLAAMVCDIKQEVEYVANPRLMTIAANEDSKCGPSEDPTIASMMSRILRWAQAVSCAICAYDPFIAQILRSGRFPQILMGSVQEGGYPQWVTPDAIPTEGSAKPVTSGGVVATVKDALLGVWHPYEEYPNFTFFAQTLSAPTDIANLGAQTTEYGAAEGDTALVANNGEVTSAVYTYTNGAWVFTKQLTKEADGLTNFAVTNILKGFYATKDVYYFDGGETPTWDVMDTDLTGIEARLRALEARLKGVVVGQDPTQTYVLGTAATLDDAKSFPCVAGTQTIVLITGA